VRKKKEKIQLSEVKLIHIDNLKEENKEF